VLAFAKFEAIDKIKGRHAPNVLVIIDELTGAQQAIADNARAWNGLGTDLPLARTRTRVELCGWDG
jgi:hypothetical protein